MSCKWSGGPASIRCSQSQLQDLKFSIAAAVRALDSRHPALGAASWGEGAFLPSAFSDSICKAILLVLSLQALQRDGKGGLAKFNQITGRFYLPSKRMATISLDHDVPAMAVMRKPNTTVTPTGPRSRTASIRNEGEGCLPYWGKG